MEEISHPHPPAEEPLTIKEKLMAGSRVFAMVVLAGLVVVMLLPESSPIPLQSQAPAVHLTSYDGQSWDLQRYRGTPILLNFWGSWCPPCLHEIPALSAAAKKYPKDVVFIGAAVNTPQKAAIAIINKFSIPYLIAATDSITVQRWGAEQIPITYLLDAAHRVVWIYRGSLDEDGITEAIDTYVLSSAPSTNP